MSAIRFISVFALSGLLISATCPVGIAADKEIKRGDKAAGKGKAPSSPDNTSRLVFPNISVSAEEAPKRTAMVVDSSGTEWEVIDLKFDPLLKYGRFGNGGNGVNS